MFPDFVHPVRLILPLLVLSLLPVQLYAGQAVLTPSLTLREEYNDNIFSLVSGRRGDYLTTVSPALALSDSSERASASLAGGVNQLLYLRNSGNDGLGYFLRGSGGYSVSPRQSLSADIGDTRDSSASSIDPTTNLVTSSPSLHQNYRLGEKYRVNESLDSSLSLGYGRDDYDNPAYLGTRHFLGNSQFDYDLGRSFPGTKLSQVLGLTRDATDISQVDSLSATLGISRELSEIWRFSLSGGCRYTHSRFQVAGSTGWGGNDEVGGLGNLSLNNAKDNIAASLTMSQDLVSASGRSGSTQMTAGNLAFSDRLTPHLSGSFTARYARNWAAQGQFGTSAIDERYLNLGGSLRYEVFELPSDLALEASYNYNNTDYRLFGAQMNQNIVMVRLIWQHQSFR